MTSTNTQKISLPFRPRARILQLLGDELIASDRLAVFELVKNAYDADASKVSVMLDLKPRPEKTITVSDDGSGMTLEDIRGVWLVLGDDHRKKQRQARHRTPIHRRLPLGEKGLGRFAAHKLGDRITLITKAHNSNECVVEINWNELIAQPFLDEAPVTVVTREPEHFLNGKTGTHIQISKLRSAWRRGEVRRLHNQITSMCSPFEETGGFEAVLDVPGREPWLEDLPHVETILERAFWKFSFTFENGKLDWDYEFRKVPGLNLESRQKKCSDAKLAIRNLDDDDQPRQKVVADASTTSEIGPIKGRFYVYDRDRKIMSRMPHQQAITRYLDEIGGVRVYRDGIRVYNYGERGDDWLGLDLRRVNYPTQGISRNIILGAIDLSLQRSTGLVEKTNREGFVDNNAFRRFQNIVVGIVEAFQHERDVDKSRIRQMQDPQTQLSSSGVDRLITDIFNRLQTLGIRDREINRWLIRIRRTHREMQESLLSAGLSGINLAVIFHEVERGVRTIHRALMSGSNTNDLVEHAKNLAQTLDGFSPLLRRNTKSKHNARKLIEAVLQFNRSRLRYHRVALRCPLLEGKETDFRSEFAFDLALGALSNLVDNAMYWTRVRYPEETPESGSMDRKMFIGVTRDFDEGPAIVVADNGTGFQEDSLEFIATPFFTHKPGGMGLGLFYATLAMELQGGQIVFPRSGEVDVPEEFDGAIVAMIFKETI